MAGYQKAGRAMSKNLDFNLVYFEGEKAHTWEYAAMQVAVLMDIRDALQTLNRLLGCPNFLRVPHHLATIATNTTRKPRIRKVC